MNTNTFIIMIALAIGLTVALVAWLFSSILESVPDEDRTWSDPPPLGFRVIWIPIQLLAHYFALLISAKRYIARSAKLSQAGIGYSMNPEQFLAGSVIWGVIIAVLAELVKGSLKLEGFIFPLVGFLVGFYYPSIWLSDRIKLSRSQMIKTLPFYLDIITLCVESGLNLNGAIQQAVSKGPSGVLHYEFQRILRDIRAGSSRAEALRSMAQRLQHPVITSFTSSLIQAEAVGMSLGPILRVQADQRRNERFTSAEKIAMEAPVKMLLPLILCIFPCVFLILLFPIIIKFMTSGM